MATDDLMHRALEVVGEDGIPSMEAIHGVSVGLAADFAGAMTITEVAELLDLSAHTLRYYERAGLVRVGRDAGGHRSYDSRAVRRLVFLTRMRLSGMPMRDLQRYVALVEQGEHTVPDRLRMLQDHREFVRQRIRELTLSLSAVEYKITTYGGAAGDERRTDGGSAGAA